MYVHLSGLIRIKYYNCFTSPSKCCMQSSINNDRIKEFPQSTYIPRVPHCLSPRRNWDPPPPPIWMTGKKA